MTNYKQAIEEISTKEDYQKKIYISNGNIHYDATDKVWTCVICRAKFQKYDWEQIAMHVNSKHTDRELGKNKRYSFKEKGNKEFAIDKEIAFDRVRLKLEFNDENQDFGKILKCTFADCTYETIDKERALGHLPKRRDIQRTKGLQCPYRSPSFAKLYTLTRHLYGASFPKLKERIQNN